MAEVVPTNILDSTPRALLEAGGYQVTPPTDITTGAGGSIVKGSPSFEVIGAIGRNSPYVEQLRKTVGGLIANYQAARLQSPFKYYNPLTGKYQVYPPTTNTNSLTNIDIFVRVVEQIAVLVYNKVISIDSDLGVQPIDKRTGLFAMPDAEAARAELAGLLGVPSMGVIQKGTRKTNSDRFGFSYTAVDILATAVFGNIKVDVKGMTALSWSLHRDKNPDRRMHESQPGQHTRGARTIAGTMIFALFDENPMRVISPIQFFHGSQGVMGDTGMSSLDETLSVDLPRFDLALTFQNEYGASSTMIIWGIDITDEGGVVSTRQNENEVTFQYKALGIQPIAPAAVDANGAIDFFAPNNQGIKLFEKKRRQQIFGDQAITNFEDKYQETLTSIGKSLGMKF